MPAVRPLPEDVERLIVEASIEEELGSDNLCQNTPVPPILFACRRYAQWAYPTFYRSIFPPKPEGMKPLIRTLSESPRLAGLVKILTFPNLLEIYDDVQTIVSLCHNISSLAYWVIAPDHYQFLELPAHSVRRLSLNLASLPSSGPASLAAFSHLTHLDICGLSIESWYPLIPNFTHLTHLMLPVADFSLEAVDIAQIPICLKAPSLRVCILFKFSGLQRNQVLHAKYLSTGQFDPRIVVGMTHNSYLETSPFPCVVRDTDAVLCDWTDRIHPDIWEKAEALLQLRSSPTTTTGNPPDQASA